LNTIQIKTRNQNRITIPIWRN